VASAVVAPAIAIDGTATISDALVQRAMAAAITVTTARRH